MQILNLYSLKNRQRVFEAAFLFDILIILIAQIF